MAESRVKLVIDSQEFDAKLKTASQNLQAYFDKVKEVGGSFEYLDDGVMDCAKALGELATKAKSTKGGISELTASFTEWSMRYKQMTDAEKNTPFGKQIRSSLDQLKARINEAKADLAEVNKELGETGSTGQETGGMLDQLAGKFGISTKALMGWGAAIAAGKVALDVAKDAFFASEQNIDEWGRTVESSQMLYEGFLNALNTGDIGGYIQNMNNIAQAAGDAYDALDRLGTMKTINAPSTSGRQTEISRLQGMLRTGRAMDSLTGGKAYADDGALLTKTQKQQIADDLKALLKESREVSQQEINQATESINALYTEQAVVLGMNTEAFKKGTANMQEFDKVLEGARKYREWEQEHSQMTSMSTSAGVVYVTSKANTPNPYEEFKAWRDFKDDGPMYQRLVQEIQKRDQATQQYYGLVNQSYRGINRAEGVGMYGTGGGNKSTTPSEKEVTIQQQIAALEKEAVTASDERLQEIILTVAALDKQLALEKEIKDVVHGRTPTLNQPVGDRKAFEQQQMVQFEAEFEPFKFDGLGQKMIASINAEIATATQNADVTTLRNLLSVTIQNGLDGIDIPADTLMKQIMGEGVNIDDTYWKSLEDSINEKLKELNLEPIKLDFKTGAVKEQAKTMAEDWRSAASAIQSVGTAMSQIEDPMAKVMGTIAQAIATIALTFAQSLKGTFTPWDWIAAATAGTATMISTIAAIKSATAGTYANGGIVPGNSYSGDNLVANVNSGELILNRAQQNNLAGQLQGGGGYGNMRLEAVISGEDLRLVLNNNGRRTGRGEYITSNFTRG